MILDISFNVFLYSTYKLGYYVDKKIKIVIDGNSKNIEQGTDKKGKFYKVYYNEEK